ncbi:hypothetical protein B0O99DRAFT_656760 [Bisporella sp. PMI_857]|nr:hypothetical protein B0O99DRAFT_656760 [Bisporella sp. PMI_857]
MSLLRKANEHQGNQDLLTSPIFTMPVLNQTQKYSVLPALPFPQYGLLAGLSDILEGQDSSKSTLVCQSQDPRIFFNISTPSSTFICGSQGSGKSHTLSCLLENCLISSKANHLPRPLTGLVFHYDTFISDHGGSPCEAAFLASNSKVKVRVFCSPTNIHIEPLRIKQSDLNTKRMLDLMAVARDDGPMPLYIHTVKRILRDMRISEQEAGTSFDYSEFKRHVMDSGLTPAQLSPLTQRLDTLESFMSASQAATLDSSPKTKGKGKVGAVEHGNDWNSKPGCLTVVDLSCPCVTPEETCSLFNICLSLFLEQDPAVGRVVALDEAHKFMNSSAEATTLTITLLSTVRLQRHLGARIIISTQEPTISPAILDLSSMTIVHRFTSPDWLHSLKSHLAGASDLLDQQPTSNHTADAGSNELKVREKNGRARRIFNEVIRLRVGEALLFSPSAIVGWGPRLDSCTEAERLGSGYLKIQVRARLTTDGGKSLIAI